MTVLRSSLEVNQIAYRLDTIISLSVEDAVMAALKELHEKVMNDIRYVFMLSDA